MIETERQRTKEMLETRQLIGTKEREQMPRAHTNFFKSASLWIITMVLLVHTGLTLAQTQPPAFSAQGFSGVFLVPNAQTLERGNVSISAGSGVPGAPKITGTNVSAGFGLLDSFEFSGTLAANSWHCNFYRDNCGGNQIRDLSTAFKWAPKFGWLNDRQLHIAIGAKDPGGAAVQFKSWYGVMEYRAAHWTALIGQAQASGPSSPLRGTFASATAHLPAGLDLTMQTVSGQSAAIAAWNLPIDGGAANLRVSAYGTFEGKTSDPSAGRGVPRSGVEASLTFPLEARSRQQRRKDASSIQLPQLAIQKLKAALHQAGYQTFNLAQVEDTGHLFLTVENDSYAESPLDAAAVAATLVAASFSKEDLPLTVSVQNRGLSSIVLRTSTACWRQWLLDSDRCADNFEVQSLRSVRIPEDAKLILQGIPAWQRPTLVFSPSLISTLGTEVGAFDYDLALNATITWPLWTGAYLDFNRVVPTGYNSDDFRNFSGAFRPQIQRAGFDRKMIHQLIRWPSLRSTFRLSAGTAYRKWEGGQIEAQTVSAGGQHRFAAIWGKFQHPVFVRQNRHEYVQYSYRYAWDERHTQTSQIQVGEFWNGDRGWQFTHRFWFGEQNVAIHVRQTRFNAIDPIASFAGLSITLPLTPRVSTGWKHLGVRGTPAFSYGFETRMKNKENLVGGGFGVFPSTGESIGLIFNRDRMGDDFFHSQQWRLRDAVRAMLPSLEPEP